MEKVKSRILIVLIVFMGILSIFIKSSSAAFTGTTDASLAEYARTNGSQFINASHKEFLGKTLTIAGGTIKNSSSTCLYHRQSTLVGTPYKIIGVLDVEGDKLKINGNDASLSEANKKYVADLSYAMYKAYTGPTGRNETIEKEALRYIFQNKIRGILPSSFSSFFTNDINGARASVGAQAMRYSYKSATKDEENEPRIKKSGSERYLGPFKVRFSGYEMNDLTVEVNGKKVSVSSYYTHKNGKYTKHSGTNIPTSTSFYIKLEDKLDTKSSWKVVLKSSGGATKYKGKMVLLSNPTASGQNLAIYAGEQDKSPEKVEWSSEGEPTDDEDGEIVIQKTDGFNGLSGAKFTIRDTNASAGSQYIIVDSNNEFKRYGSYSQATKFETDGTGKITVTGLPKNHTYEVKERKAPDGYELSSNSEQSRLLSSGTVTYTFVNEPEDIPEGSTIIIKKVDKNTNEPIAGVGFKIDLVYNCISQEGQPFTKPDTFSSSTNANGKIVYSMNLDETVQSVDCTVTEISVPSPYKLENQNQSDLIQKDTIYPNTTKTFKFENEAYGKLKIIKKNQHGNPVFGATFNIAYLDENENKNYISGFTDGKADFGGTPNVFRTNSNGIIEIDGLPLNGADKCTYLVEEVEAPNGYIVNFQPGDKEEKIVNASGELKITTQMFRFWNDSYGKLKIIKKDKNGNPVYDAKFNIAYLDENENKTYISGYNNGNPNFGPIPNVFRTDSNGTIEIDRLPLHGLDECTYLVEELDVSNGYKIDFQPEDEKEKVVEVSGEVEIVNIETGTAKIRKIGSNKETLRDVQFVLAAPSGEYLKINNLDYANGSITVDKYEDIEYVSDREEATIFITDGTTTIENIPTGEYTFEELYNDNYGYKHNVDKTFKIKVEQGDNDIEVENEQILANLEIHKVDKRALAMGNEVNLENIEFKIRLTEISAGEGIGNNIYKYIQLVNSSGQRQDKLKGSSTINKTNTALNGEYHVEYVDSADQATTFVTDSEGRIFVNNLEVYKGKDEKYTYYIDEISMGEEYSPYYDVKTYQESLDDKDYLELEKNEGGKNTQKLIQNYQRYVNLSGYVWEDIANNKGSKPDGYWVYGSLDKRVDKDNLGNGKYKGIKVNLVKDGEILAWAETDNNGEYFFPSQMKTVDPTNYPEIKYVQPYGSDKYKDKYEGYKIVIDELPRYSIEFIYNGLKYESVAFPPDIQEYWKKDNSSKALDNSENRRDINQAFNLIQGKEKRNGGGTVGTNGENSVDLKYTNEEYISRLVQNTRYTSESLGSENSINPNSVNPSTRATVKASTKDGNYTIPFIPGETKVRKTVENINLGIFERTQPDLAIATDIENIRLTINGSYSHTYEYKDRSDFINTGIPDSDLNPGYDAALDGFSVSVKNRRGKYKDCSYIREVYDSYIAYTKHDSTNPDRLRVFVTYKLVVKNEGTGLLSKVSLKNYADTRLQDPKSYYVTDSGEHKSVEWTGHNNGEWKTDIIDYAIKPTEWMEIYLTYELNTDTVVALASLGTPGNTDKELRLNNNVTEIISYQTFDLKGAIYGGIDKDSAPNNMTYSATGEDTSDTYEDDTDVAPELKFKRKDSKIISGIVYEDSTSHELKTGQERLSNGKYDDEKKVENVDVQILKYAKNNSGQNDTIKLYNLDGNGNVKVTNAQAITGTDGAYRFTGFVPGEYFIQYTYGDYVREDKNNTNQQARVQTKIDDGKVVTTESYKSTIVDTNRFRDLIENNIENDNGYNNMKNNYEYNKNNGNAYNSLWYWYEKSENYLYSSAVDDSSQRRKINQHLSTIDNKVQTDYEDRNDMDYHWMKSNSGIIDFPIEDTREQTTDINYVEGSRDYQLKFGIVERPRQSLEVNKEISYVRITLANGQILVEGDPREQNINYLTYPERGTLKIEVDNEIIEGATLDITYEIKVENKSEVDYDDITIENLHRNQYYRYGNHDGLEPVKIRLDSIVDYVDEKLSVTYDIGQPGSEYIYYEPNVTKFDIWQLISKPKDETNQLAGVYIDENVYASVENRNNIVVKNTKTEISPILPNNVATLNLSAKKLLTDLNNTDQLFDNYVELIKVSDPVGRFYGEMTNGIWYLRTPGNFDVNNVDVSECDNNNYNRNYRKAQLTIVPPTGGTAGTVMIYTIIGVACLVILSGGIILIKKKILN